MRGTDPDGRLADQQRIVAQITEYNDAILRRQKLLENSSERSPVIQDMDNVLAAVRRSIIASLNSHVSTLEIQLTNMRKEEALANHRLSTMPSQEKVLLDIMRQQKIRRSCSSTCSTSRRRRSSTMPSPKAIRVRSTRHTAAPGPCRPVR